MSLSSACMKCSDISRKAYEGPGEPPIIHYDGKSHVGLLEAGRDRTDFLLAVLDEHKRENCRQPILKDSQWYYSV